MAGLCDNGPLWRRAFVATGDGPSVGKARLVWVNCPCRALLAAGANKAHESDDRRAGQARAAGVVCGGQGADAAQSGTISALLEFER